MMRREAPIVRTADVIRAAKREGRFVGLFGIEGGHNPEGKGCNVATFWEAVARKSMRINET